MKEHNRIQGNRGTKIVSFSRQGSDAWVDITHPNMGISSLREVVTTASETTGVDASEIYEKLRAGGYFDWQNKSQ